LRGGGGCEEKHGEGSVPPEGSLERKNMFLVHFFMGLETGKNPQDLCRGKTRRNASTSGKKTFRSPKKVSEQERTSCISGLRKTASAEGKFLDAECDKKGPNQRRAASRFLEKDPIPHLEKEEPVDHVIGRGFDV